MRSLAWLVVVVAAAACHKRTEPTAAKGAAGSATDPGAPVTDPWASQPVKKDPLAHPLLWSIEKDGTTSYALGTFHVGVDAEAKLPQLVWDKLDAAKTLVTETDLTDPMLQTAFSERHDGKTLHEELGDEYWSKLAARLPHPDPRPLDHVDREQRSRMLAQRIQAQSGGRLIDQIDHGTATRAAAVLPASGIQVTPEMDAMLVAHATNRKEQLVYLEPADTQVKLLLEWMDARALRMMLDDLDALGREARERIAAYMAGDEAEIAAQGILFFRADWKRAGRSDAEYDRMMEELIYQRNASWIDEIERVHAHGGGFIAVGALHLIGKRSVLDLLAKRGYKITRLGS